MDESKHEGAAAAMRQINQAWLGGQVEDLAQVDVAGDTAVITFRFFCLRSGLPSFFPSNFLRGPSMAALTRETCCE